MPASAPTHTLPHVLIIHEVHSYPHWKTVFDGAAGLRKEAGEISYEVLRDDQDPNLIVHYSAWSSHEAARRFFESPRLVQLRKEAGVATPRFLYLQSLESGVL